ncbi:MAG: SRPBCC family protein [Nevskiaceae bacterium]|nr:MAG: SRPBCC family protein [Nevskiaceae bacterium]
MQTIEVRRTIRAPIEQVFEQIADHEGYARFPGVRKAVLTQAGKTERNGLGAVREISAGPAWFREAITVFQRPTRMDYQITASRPPLEHRGGSIRLQATADGTAVTWTTTMRVRVPLIGGLLTRITAAQLTQAFTHMLAHIDQQLTGTSAP